MNINISIELDWPSYEDDINDCVKQVILREVATEVKKHCGDIRKAVADKLEHNKNKLVEDAMKSIGNGINK